MSDRPMSLPCRGVSGRMPVIVLTEDRGRFRCMFPDGSHKWLRRDEFRTEAEVTAGGDER